MGNAQFIPVVLPNENIGAASGDSAPGLGHAGFILVDSSGHATFNEYGPYQNGATNVVTSNPLSPNTANIRATPITNGTIQFDGSGNVTAASLQNALNQIFGSGGPYAGADPGVVSATPFTLSTAQYNGIAAGLNTFVTNVNGGGLDATYDLFGRSNGPNCINFVYAMAGKASSTGGDPLTISTTQNSGLLSIPSLAADGILAQADSASIPSYEYFTPSSWNATNGQSNITSVTSFNQVAWDDAGVQFGDSLAKLAQVAFTSAQWATEQTLNLGGNVYEKIFGATNGDKLTETLNGSMSPITLAFANSSGTPIAQLAYNADASDTLTGYNSGGTVQWTQTGSFGSAGQALAAITGIGDTTFLSNATITFAAGAQAALDGANDAIALAINVALTFGAGAVNDTVNVNGAGTSVNMTGAGGAVRGDTITTVGSTEKLAFSTVETVTVAETTQTHITGTDGTLTTDTQGANNPFQNTVNWNAGGSQNQVINPGNGATLEFLNFTGANATGTDTQNILDLISGGSQQQLFTGLPTGDIEIVNYFTAPNDAGTLTSTTWNASAGGSVTEWFNPTAALATEVGAYTGYNDAGSNLYNVLNYSAGGSQLQQLNPAALPAGVTLEDENFSGTGLTGTDTQNTLNFSTNTSQLQLFTGLPTGDTEVVDDYAGLNLSGKLNNTIWDASNGTSVIESYTPTSAIATEASGYTGLNATGTDQYNVVNYTAGGSLYQQLTGLQSGVTESMEGFSGAGLTGTEKYTLTDHTNSTSDLDLLAPASGVVSNDESFTGLNASGLLNTAITTNTDNSTVDTTYVYGGSTLAGFVEKFYGTNGSYLGTAAFTASGNLLGGGVPNGGVFQKDISVTVVDGGINLDDGSGFDDGGSLEVTSGTKVTGTNIANIAPYVTNQVADSPAWNAAQAAGAEISLVSQLQSAGSPLAASSFYEDTKWSGKTVTWSLAAMAGASGSPFSSYMGPQYAALVQKAFATWGAASGITFQEVADSGQSDIRIGWGDFSTSSSGVVGYTSYQYQNGQMQPNVIIRLEDPSKNSLVGAPGSGSAMTPSSALSYSGTQANLYQVLMHEIGHALGLADNGDSNSVMYFQAQGASNSTLDGNDIAGMQALYGTGPSTLSFASDPSSQAAMNSTIQQMNQAVAFFHSEQSAAPLFGPQPELSVPSPLGVPQGTVV